MIGMIFKPTKKEKKASKVSWMEAESKLWEKYLLSVWKGAPSWNYDQPKNNQPQPPNKELDSIYCGLQKEMLAEALILFLLPVILLIALIIKTL